MARTPRDRGEAATPRLRDTGITLEPAHADDAPTLAELRVAAMQASLERAGRFDPDRARARFLTGFAPAHTRHVCRDAQRIGVVVVRPDGDAWRLDHLYIHPDHQGRGAGTAVLERLFAEADAARKTLRVGALKGSAANRFYAARGFAHESDAEHDTYYTRAAQGEPPLLDPP